MFTPLYTLAVVGLTSGALVAGELAIEKKPFEVTSTLDAVVMPAAPVALISLEPKAWSQFTILTVIDHGAAVKKGDVLLEIDSRDIDKEIEDLQTKIDTRAVEITQQKAQLEKLEETASARIAALRHAAEVATENHEYFTKTDRKVREESSAQSLEEQKQYLENQQEELRQLKAMYQADDLTEETEEIILTRQQNAVQAAEFRLRMGKLKHQREISVYLPRRATALAEAERQAAIELKYTESEIPRESTLAKAELEALETAQARATQRLDDLKHDRKQFAVTATTNGTFYHGTIRDGKWTTGELIRSLRPGGSAPQHVAFATVVPQETAMALVAHTPPATARLLTNGKTATTVLKGDEANSFEATITDIASVPDTDGKHAVTLNPTWNKTTAASARVGNPAHLHLLAHYNPEAISIPTDALRFGANGWTVEVKLADGKTERRTVQPGLQSGDETEILSGLDAGQVIVTP